MGSPGVYILESARTGRYYIGSTNDTERRLKEHNAGQVTSTRRGRPWNLRYFIKMATLEEARKAERRLKKYKSKGIIRKVVESGVLPWQYRSSD